MAKIKLRRDTAANWTTANVVLAQGEPGVDLTNKKMKIGDGITAWNSLPYFDDQETVLTDFAGNITPSVDDTYTLGTPSKRWKDLFVANASIYIGDVKLSNVGGKLTATKVINPGEENEEEDPEDSDATSDIGGAADLGSFTMDGNVIDVESGTDIYIETYETDGDGESRLILKPQDDDGGDNPTRIEGSYGVGIWSNTTSSGDSVNKWLFGTDGWLSFPGTFPSGAIGYDDDTETLQLARFGGVSLYSQAGAWVFGQDGNLQLPPNGDIVDSNGDSVLGGGGVASLTDDKEVKVTVGNTEYWAIVNRSNNDDSGVESQAVAYDSEDNMIVLHVRNASTDQGGEKIVISKFDTTATLLWQKQLSSDADTTQGAHDLLVDDDDNIFIAHTADNGSAIDNIVVLKLDSNGAILWQKSYQGDITSIVDNTNIYVDPTTVSTTTFGGNPAQSITLNDIYSYSAVGHAFSSTTNGTDWTYIGTVIGETKNNNNGTTTLYFAAATFEGDLDEATYDYKLNGTAVNTWHELGAMTCDGTDIYFAGEFEESVDVGDPRAWITKVSGTNGAVVWSQYFTWAGNSQVYGIDVGADGDVVAVGRLDTPGPTVAFVSKFDGEDGSHVWSTFVADLVDEDGHTGGDVVVDSQNNIFVSINSNRPISTDNDDTDYNTIAHIIKFNSSGAEQWTRRVGPGPCASVATGIDCDSSGNVFLSALTATNARSGRDIDDIDGLTARSVLAVVKYSTAGTVLWQRYIETEGYEFISSSNDGGGTPGQNFNYGENRGRYLSLNNSGKLAVQVTVRQLDPDGNWFNTQYNESITFQIDQDGREMTVGSGSEKFTVKESRIPGKMVTLPITAPAVETEPAITDLADDLTVTTTTHTLSEGEMAQLIVKSAPYEYVFGNDGTLTIPNDGDIKLVQTQIGWFSIFGPTDNDNDDVWIRANCVDPATGDVYVVGQEDVNQRGFVAQYNKQGQVQWSIRLNDNDEGYNTRCNAVKLNPVTGNLNVLCEYYGNQTGALMVEIDPDTAQVVNSFGFRDQNENSDVQAYDFDYFSNGDVAVVGRKYDEFNSISVVPQTGSGVSTLIILNSATASNAVHPVQNSWYVSGTGITGRAAVQYVNRYTGVTGTTRQGSGAVFSITIGGSGPYTYESVTATTAGTNYRVGHKIKILGTDLEGLTPTNDAIIEVTEINGSGGITAATISGTYGNAQAAPYTYTGKTGTNHNVGSGATFDVTVDDSGAFAIDTISAAGTNYVENDYITILGTVFAGGTAPANNLSLVVGSVSTGGISTISSASGSAPTTHRKIEISDSVDFGGTGSWSVVHDLGGEAFIVRYDNEGGITWSKVLSGGGQYDSGERYYSVAIDSSNNVYAAGEMYSRGSATIGDLVSYQCAVVSKFNSAGVPQWHKVLNDTLNDCSAKSVVVRGTTVVVSHFNLNNFDTVITKLDTTGVIKWQRVTDSNDDSSVAIDTNGDIYAVVEANLENKYEDIIKLIKFATNGEIVWRKFLGTLVYDYGGTHEYFKNGRNLTIDADHMYISGYTTAFANNFDCGFLVKLPKTGDFDGSYGAWGVQVDMYNVLKVVNTEATTFTPTVNTGNWESWNPNFETNWWDPSGNSYYHTLNEIHDRDGGAIEFADGTRQTSSAQQIPQVPITNGADHRLCLEDMGKHIYVTNNNTSITVPYNDDAQLPIGFTVVIVNNSGSVINIDGDGGGVGIIVPGVATSSYWDLSSPGMATLIKVDYDTWFMTGNVTDDS